MLTLCVEKPLMNKVTIKIQCFGIARDICGEEWIELPYEEGLRVDTLQTQLRDRYPALGELRHFFIARNQTYALAEELVLATDELVILPPVSGG